jgi:hypothetical protein
MSEPSVFIVRVWRGVTPFRAAVRPVEEDETRVFSDPAELLCFLEQGTPQPVDRPGATVKSAPTQIRSKRR